MGVDSVDEKLDPKDPEDDPTTPKRIRKRIFKNIIILKKKRYGRKMFDNVEEKVDSNIITQKIKVMKSSITKAPDATIPAPRDGLTPKTAQAINKTNMKTT